MLVGLAVSACVGGLLAGGFAVSLEPARAASTANTTQQIKALKRQVASLARQVAALRANDSISARQIVEGAVGASELADNSVFSPEIADGAVGASELLNNSVGSLKLTDDSVGPNQLADGAVGSGEIANRAVQFTDLAAASVRGSVLGPVLPAKSAGTEIKAGETVAVVAECPAGSRVLSGAYEWAEQDRSDMAVVASTPAAGLSIENRWLLSGHVDAGGEANTLFAEALCLFG